MTAALLLCPICAQSTASNGSLMLLGLLAVPFLVSGAVFYALRRLDA
jgi:hypothetical protein